VPVVDLTPAQGDEAVRALPRGSSTCNTHLREPGDGEAETLASGARAAAAGGFHAHRGDGQHHTTDRHAGTCLAEARLAASNLPVSILQIAALTRGLDGEELVDIRKCVRGGRSVALGDDGRNGVSPRQLAIALAETAHLSRAGVRAP